MNRNYLLLLLGGGLILLIVLGVLLLLRNQSAGNLHILTNQSNIVSYGVIDEQTVIYQTTANSIIKSSNNQQNLLLQYDPKDSVIISPTGKYFSAKHGSEVTIYVTTTNQPLIHFNVAQFAWQKNDAYIYTLPIAQTTDPALALDGDAAQIVSTIKFVPEPGKAAETIDTKVLNSLIFYSASPKVLYYLTPNTGGNPLQESRLIKDTFPDITQLGIYSNYEVKTFNDGIILSDISVGTNILSDGNIYTNKKVTIQSGLQKINAVLSSLTLVQHNNRWNLDITGIDSGKTQSIELPLPTDFNGQNLRNPQLRGSMVFFQTDSGIYSTEIGGSNAQ